LEHEEAFLKPLEGRFEKRISGKKALKNLEERALKIGEAWKSDQSSEF